MDTKLPADIVSKLLVVLLIAAAEVSSAGEVDDIVGQARKYDNAYTLGPQTSQQKALELYQSALAAGPSKEQRLEILFRMAQLNGSAYQKEKGEKPDYQKAISLYKQILDEYPPDEPLVYKAKLSISSHYTTLRQFEDAANWAKQTLEYDTSQLQEQLDSLQKQSIDFDKSKFSSDIDEARNLSKVGPAANNERETRRERQSVRNDEARDEKHLESIKLKAQMRLLEKSLNSIKSYQKTAVDQLAYTCDRISYLRTHGELRNIAEKYTGTFIAQRADELLRNNMDKMPKLWAPQNEPMGTGESAIQASSPAPPANLGQKQVSLEIQSPNITPELKKELCPVEPNITGKSQNHNHVAEIRDPTFGFFSKCIIGAIGLIVLGIGIIIVKKKPLFKEFRK